MQQLIDHLWFWLFLISIFLLLFTAYLCGGLSEINGWVWATLIAGILIGILAIFWASKWWSERHTQALPNDYRSQPSMSQHLDLSQSEALSLRDKSSVPNSMNMSEAFSPIGTPTPAVYNIPQLKRGFTHTKQPLSSLASL